MTLTPMNPTQLSDYVVDMPRAVKRVQRKVNGTLVDAQEMVPTDAAFEELIAHMKPWLWKAERWYIPGFSQEDLRSEAMMVLWNCSSQYKRGKGSFLNLAKRSLENRYDNLRNTAVAQTPVSSITCLVCGGRVLPELMQRTRNCRTCGQRNWDIKREPFGVRPLADVWDGDSVTEQGSRFADRLTDLSVVGELEDVELRVSIEQAGPGFSDLVRYALTLPKGHSLTVEQSDWLREELFA